MQPISEQFQTPPFVARYMISLIPDGVKTVLEPTPGQGNIVKELNGRYEVIAPQDFFLWQAERVDCVVMNPPFTPMKKGYQILYECMELSNNIIALMPWLTIINSEKRTKDILDFGLVSITHLPRNIFQGARVQTCILQMEKCTNYKTVFYDFCRVGESK